MTAQLLTSSASVGISGIITGVIGIQAAVNGDRLFACLLFTIAFIALARVVWLRYVRSEYGATPPDLATARQWGRDYALGSFATSFMIGVTSLCALSYRDPAMALLTVSALCCYVFSMILRTAMRPLICLPSVAIAVTLALAGLPLFLHDSSRLSPIISFATLTTVPIVLVLSCVQLAGHLYRTTLSQAMAQRDLMRFARRDPLTGLTNRLALREHFELLLPGPTRLAAFLYLDLDGFKPVNDLHGHQVGDALLCGVAGRLTAGLRPGEGAFRIGGDEFVVLLSRVRQRSDATALARRLLASLSEPFVIDGETVHIAASIGIAFADGGNTDLDDLAASADAALYEAKRNGGGTFRFAKDTSSLRLIA